LNDPFEAPPMDWSQVNNGQGLKDVNVSDGSNQQQITEWGLNPNLTSDMTNAQMVSGLSGVLSDDDIFGLGKHQDYINSGDFSTRDSVNSWVTNNPYRNDAKWSSGIGQLGQNLFTPTTTTQTVGANTPTGYARPI
jgi:hypothetical protein